MYSYDRNDTVFLEERINQFSGQVERYKEGDLDDDKFRSLRLRNGLYLELYAYMLRVAIPYGVLNSAQLRQLAFIADKYDRGYGHFTTRQNIQFNWIQLDDITDILADLSKVSMHAIQTSGKVVRNITTDYLSGVCADEIEDARPYCEIIRQWFIAHPEFSWMAGKLKISMSASKEDRAAIQFHDIGLQLIRNQKNELGFKVYVGGGLGSYPVIAKELNSFLPVSALLSYIESILRIYNLKGRRDNPKRNRIKFLVKELGINQFKKMVTSDWNASISQNITLTDEDINPIKDDFKIPIKPIDVPVLNQSVALYDDKYQNWLANNTKKNKIVGYSIAVVSLSPVEGVPGDVTSKQLSALADLAEKYSHNEIRTTNTQNLVFPYVNDNLLYELWLDLKEIQLEVAHQGTIADINCCPGADYCSLAKTSSIAITKTIQNRFKNIYTLSQIGDLKLNVSGCENSCAHHHIADIGLLGMKKNNKEFYQITLAGESKKNSVIGVKLGPSIDANNTVNVIEKIINLYLKNRIDTEKFTDVFKRIGIQPFKKEVYGT